MYLADKFEGACIDSGAEMSVIGYRKAQAYALKTGSKFKETNFPLS